VSTAPTLLWLRQDLRLADNPALHDALGRGAPVIPVYIDAAEEEGAWRPGAASRWWLHHSLAALDTALRRCGSQLVLRRGRALDVLRELVRDSGAGTVVWNRRYEPAVMERDRLVKDALQTQGVRTSSHNGALLIEPWEVGNKGGGPFRVYTPYWRRLMATLQPPLPLAAPAHLLPPARWPRSLALDELGLLPVVPWYREIRAVWQPGEAGALRRLESFCDSALAGYRDRRERPDIAGTSRLSPHLHFGEISPRQLWHAIGAAESRRGLPAAEWRHGKFPAELIWREFAYHLLFHFPHTVDAPLQSAFKAFPWREDAAQLAAWQRGRTGIALVDAGMQELWRTGWMHNRVRMVVASFLVKNLRIGWQQGARWFWDTLVDADLASNTLGWQWSAGCGADAAPYFRIFNPNAQAAKFDPDGVYVARWLDAAARARTPIVDLAATRTAALEAWRAMRAAVAADSV
jgi:deoxyribodipyrimidine photo-lyase